LLLFDPPPISYYPPPPLLLGALPSTARRPIAKRCAARFGPIWWFSAAALPLFVPPALGMSKRGLQVARLEARVVGYGASCLSGGGKNEFSSSPRFKVLAPRWAATIPAFVRSVASRPWISTQSPDRRERHRLRLTAPTMVHGRVQTPASRMSWSLGPELPLVVRLPPPRAAVESRNEIACARRSR